MQTEKPVFLIEDDLVDALTIRRAFKELGVQNQLIHCKNGEEALALIDEQPAFSPALILLDLNMPKMGGLEFLKVVRSKNLCADTPIVILTTSTESQDRSQCFEYHVQGYLIKPVNYKHFVEMIQSLAGFLSINSQLGKRH